MKVPFVLPSIIFPPSSSFPKSIVNDRFDVHPSSFPFNKLYIWTVVGMTFHAFEYALELYFLGLNLDSDA